MACRAEKARPLSSSLNMERRTITNVVITAFIVIMHNNDSNRMAVNWKHNTDFVEKSMQYQRLLRFQW